MFDEFESNLEPEECPDCGSKRTRSVDYTNYHKCEDCSAMWGFNEGDLNDIDNNDEIPVEFIEFVNEQAKELNGSNF